MNSETARRPGAKGSSVDSYRIHVPDEVLADLSARLQLTRFPDYFSEGDWDMGIDVPYIRELVAYWRSHFDWRAYEDRLNRLPHYTTTIDNQNIHFIHVRSPRPNALPLLMVHGWPGSVIEFRKVVDRLVDPPRDGSEERQAFSSGHTFAARLRLFRADARARLEHRADRSSLRRIDAPAWLFALRRPGRRLGGHDHNPACRVR